LLIQHLIGRKHDRGVNEQRYARVYHRGALQAAAA
jgi:hypothetical protein